MTTTTVGPPRAVVLSKIEESLNELSQVHRAEPYVTVTYKARLKYGIVQEGITIATEKSC